LGGTANTNAEALASIGVLDKFLNKITAEWQAKFPEPWNGEDLEYKLPNTIIPNDSQVDFDNCKSTSHLLTE
jgi:hypothetical protein